MGEPAAACKQQGNERLKAGDDQGALAAYLHGLELSERGPLRSQLHSNCAHVLLRQSGCEEKALEHCCKAIENDAGNIKAHWRAATAALRLSRPEEAERHCRQGLAVERGNRELLALLDKVNSTPSKASSAPSSAVKLEKASSASSAVARLQQVFAQGKELLEGRDVDEALKAFESTLEQARGEKSSSAINQLRWETYEKKAHCHFLRQEWWEVIKASESAASYCYEQDLDSMLRESRAFRELGLLHTADEKLEKTLLASRLGEGASDRPCGRDSTVTAAAESLRHEVLSAKKAVEEGDPATIHTELLHLQGALPCDEVERWRETVRTSLRTEQGRLEMVDQGFAQQSWLGLPDQDREARTLQRLLLCQVKKRLQQELSLAPVPEGGVALTTKYTFVSPASLRHQRAGRLLGERQLGELRGRGLAVVEQAFDEASMSRLRAECEWLDKGMGMLSKDDEDTCNPLQRKFDVPLGNPEIVEACRKETPTLFAVLDCLRGLPALLEEGLGLELRVPEAAMLSCYPPGAFYRRHLDSYGGKDIPRKVTILLYCNPGWTPGDGGLLRAWLGGEIVEFEPRAGRVIVFMSQDIWHEVTESKAERYALTQWVWDVQRDVLGR